MALAPSSASAQDFSWTGAAPLGEANWSNPANWEGVAPAASVGTLSFPALPGTSCASQPPAATCYESNNDLTGLLVGSISIDDGVGYQLTGNPISLGAEGVTAAPSANDPPALAVPQLKLPISLSASQTWSISGGPQGQQLGVDGNINGAAENLAIHFVSSSSSSPSSSLNLSADAEVGPVLVTGHGVVGLFESGEVGQPSLNGTDGNRVELKGGAGLVAFGLRSSTGPLTLKAGQLQVGDGAAPGGTLAVTGAVVLGSATNLLFFIDHSGTTPGADFSQLSAAGRVDLGNAHLRLGDAASPSAGQARCAPLKAGDIDTLIKSTGPLTGRFNDIPSGTVVPLGNCASGTAPTAKINYTAHAVIAKVETAGPPILGKSQTVKVLKQPVSVRVKGSSRFVPMTGAASLPDGSEVDATNGRVLITVATPKPHETASAELHGGRFRINQGRAHRGETRFSLSLPLTGCPGAAASHSRSTALAARRSGPQSRHLWGSEHGGHWGTNGHYVSTTVEGTRWLTLDTCTRSEVKVAAGRVRVRDLITNEARTLSAGESYIAHAKRHPGAHR